MNLLPDFLFESFNRFESHPAIFCNNKLYTYHELSKRIASIQEGFRQKDLKKGEFVGIVTGQDIDTYAAILAMVFSGIPYVPINRKNPYDRFVEIVKEAELSTVLFSTLPQEIENKRAAFESENIHLLNLESITVEHDGPPVKAETKSEDYIYMIFTSGSTGKPKGVLVKHRNLSYVIDLYVSKEHYDFTPEDRFLQMFDWTFDLAGMMTFIPLSIGASCYIVPEEGIKYYNIISTLLDKRITVSMIVPSTLLYIKPYIKELRLPDLRYSMFCGEPLLHDLMVDWSECVSEDTVIQNVYGPSECPGASSFYTWNKEESEAQAVNGVVPIGKPVPEMEFILVDDSKNQVNGNQGSIALHSPQVSDGYWEDPVRTQNSYYQVNGKSVYDTGDIAILNDCGNYVFLGRRDHQLKLDGYRVEPGEIEYVVRNLLGSDTKAAFVAMKNEKGILIPHLFIEKLDRDTKELFDYLESKLPPYMIPHQIHSIDSFPKNFNGKIDRNALMAMLAESTTG